MKNKSLKLAALSQRSWVDARWILLRKPPFRFRKKAMVEKPHRLSSLKPILLVNIITIWTEELKWQTTGSSKPRMKNLIEKGLQTGSMKNTKGFNFQAMFKLTHWQIITKKWIMTLSKGRESKKLMKLLQRSLRQHTIMFTMQLISCRIMFEKSSISIW